VQALGVVQSEELVRLCLGKEAKKTSFETTLYLLSLIEKFSI
jgi:hypothetical protein